MKWLIIYSLLILSLASCSSVKRDRQVINAFLDPQLTKKQYDTIFVVEKPVPSSGILKLFQNPNKDEYNSYTLIKIGNQNLAMPLDSLKINKLDTLFQKEVNWTKEDFTLPVQIATGNLNTNEFISSHLSPKNHVLYLSKPVYTKDKKYALFCLDIRAIPISSASSLIDYKDLIIMEKINGKWIHTAVITDNMIE
ncbi:hypothetical protein AM493_10760 [Flavobacterium akiainvivens]|uniref:Lipoprotein n=1 Tax=Flavobacterium akiainvivens TaxID=1202724 RepID=A0A0M8M9N8_9FLAO|nr:hypothetical protein [Flavobacterium akiainvivens]KOS06463.1 hypothetical protein AM493_10760 [Flavobacterium akiainvivens]SFQ12975.1 hypothetical protein SAMN05444144_101210 [Flavobacterium akiainvivens]